MKTTAEKISVMSAYENGAKIESRVEYQGGDWFPNLCPEWSWNAMDYRVAPAAPKTVKKKVVLVYHNFTGDVTMGEENWPKDSSPTYSKKTIEVEFVVDGGSDENAKPEGWTDIPQTLEEGRSYHEKMRIKAASEAAPSFEDGSPQLEVERLRHKITELNNRRVILQHDNEVLQSDAMLLNEELMRCKRRIRDFEKRLGIVPAPFTSP